MNSRRRDAFLRAAILLSVMTSPLPAPAHAGDVENRHIEIPEGMLLCPTALDFASVTHAGCWYSRGGQTVERIHPAVTWAQVILRSSDGSETLPVYTSRADADRLVGSMAETSTSAVGK